MIAIISAIISGISMSLQGIFNTRLGEKIGIWETNVFVQASGLGLTLIILMFFGKGNFKNIKETNKLYLLGGILGVIIIFTVMKSIGSLGATCGISIILVAQLLAAAAIDAFALFGSKRVPFNTKEFIGVGIMIIGIIIFKWKC